MVLFGPCGVVNRVVSHKMFDGFVQHLFSKSVVCLHHEDMHVDVCLLLQGSCGIFPSRSVSMSGRLLATRGQSLVQQFCYVVFVRVSLETYRMVWCLFRACTARVCRVVTMFVNERPMVGLSVLCCLGKTCSADEGYSVLEVHVSVKRGSRGFEQSSPSFTKKCYRIDAWACGVASFLCCFQVHVDRAAFSIRC